MKPPPSSSKTAKKRAGKRTFKDSFVREVLAEEVLTPAARSLGPHQPRQPVVSQVDNLLLPSARCYEKKWKPLKQIASLHLKIGFPNRKFIFQPYMFRGYVSFREGNTKTNFWGKKHTEEDHQQKPWMQKTGQLVVVFFVVCSFAILMFWFLINSSLEKTRHHFWSCQDTLVVDSKSVLTTGVSYCSHDCNPDRFW